jgi:hydrogenase expression/formation protein HypC
LPCISTRDHNGNLPSGQTNNGIHCVACSDEALPARVLAVLPGGNAMVEINRTIEEINVQLVDTAAGDLLLVHAKVAIARLTMPACPEQQARGGRSSDG